MEKKIRERRVYEAPDIDVADMKPERHLCVASVFATGDLPANGHEDYDSGEMSLEDYD